jgi:outer membrane protein OmpA-like peptidoglycan-associated protein
MSKLILLLTLLIGAFLTFMCVNENKTALSAKYSQIENKPIESVKTEVIEPKEPIQSVKTKVVKPKEIEKAYFTYKRKELFSAKLSPKDKTPNFEYFKSRYCPDTKCKQDITFNDQVEVTTWQDEAINKATFLEDQDIKGGAIFINDTDLKIEGELNNEQNFEQLNKLLEPFSKNNFKINNITTIKKTIQNTAPSAQQIQFQIADLLKNEPIYFEHASATITPESKVTLDKIIAAVQNIQPLNLRVEGHTDAVGNRSYNMYLSQQRADSVRKYLKNTISTAEISATGFGETKPISSNPRDEINRRVEIYIEGGE